MFHLQNRPDVASAVWVVDTVQAVPVEVTLLDTELYDRFVGR